VIEFDPVTLEIVWQYTFLEAGALTKMGQYSFYSPLISSAQRLANGNTLITEGSAGRMIEVTPDHDIVWEFINPYFHTQGKSNYVYRAYRVPYQWVPQLDRPEEKKIERVTNSTFRVPGGEVKPEQGVTSVEGARGFTAQPELCVVDMENAAK
jgi:hypothetical protein